MRNYKLKKNNNNKVLQQKGVGWEKTLTALLFLTYLYIYLTYFKKGIFCYYTLKWEKVILPWKTENKSLMKTKYSWRKWGISHSIRRIEKVLRKLWLPEKWGEYARGTNQVRYIEGWILRKQNYRGIKNDT